MDSELGLSVDTRHRIRLKCLNVLKISMRHSQVVIGLLKVDERLHNDQKAQRDYEIDRRASYLIALFGLRLRWRLLL